DIGMASELVRFARSDQRVDRSAREQRSERLGAGVLLELNGTQQRRRVRPAVRARFAHGALHPSDGCEIHIELMDEMTTEAPMTSKDSVREDIAFVRHAIEQGRGYAGAHSLDLLVWGVALAAGYLGTYATVTGWWLINPNWLWAVCIVLPWLYSLR